MAYTFDFEKTDEEVIVESINSANRTNFKTTDFTFGDITNDGDITVLELTDRFNHTELIKYLRFDIGEFFANIPLIVDGVVTTDDDLLELLLIQRKLYLDKEKIQIEDITVDDDVKFKITILPNNLCWFGEVIVKIRPVLSLNERSIKQKFDIYRNYGNTDDLKVPIALAYQTLVDPSTYYKVFNRYGAGDILGASVDILSALSDITKDKWIYSDNPADFNLKGAEVIYVGPNYGNNYNGNPKVSHLFKVRLSQLCSNLYGELVVEYVDPNRSNYYNMNINSTWSTKN